MQNILVALVDHKYMTQPCVSTLPTKLSFSVSCDFMTLCCVKCIRPQSAFRPEGSDHDVEGPRHHVTQGKMEDSALVYSVEITRG